MACSDLKRHGNGLKWLELVGVGWSSLEWVGAQFDKAPLEMIMKLVATQFSCLFLSFVLKKLILIKHSGKVNFHPFNRIIYIPFI